MIKQTKRVGCGFRSQVNFQRRILSHIAGHPTTKISSMNGSQPRSNSKTRRGGVFLLLMADLPDDPADRIDEVLWRAILRADLERWAHEAVLDPEACVPTRGSNRLEIVEEALEPLA